MKTPCYRCIYIEECSDGKACEQFYHYLNTGRIDTKLKKQPMRKYYELSFPGIKNKSKRVRISNLPIDRIANREWVIHSPEDALTIKEFARMVNISKAAVRKSIKRGEIPAFLMDNTWYIPREYYELTMEEILCSTA